MKALSFYVQNLKSELKILVSTNCYGFLETVYGFSNLAQKVMTSAKLWKPELIGKCFQKLLWCPTILQNFLLLAYPYPEILAAGMNSLTQGLHEPKEPGCNRVSYSQ